MKNRVYISVCSVQQTPEVTITRKFEMEMLFHDDDPKPQSPSRTDLIDRVFHDYGTGQLTLGLE